MLMALLTTGAGTEAANAHFAQKLDHYLQGYFAFRPGEATDLGLHDWDEKLPDLSRPAIDAEVARLKAALKTFGAIDPATLGKDERIDLKLLLASMKGELLELTEVRSWQHR